MKKWETNAHVHWNTFVSLLVSIKMWLDKNRVPSRQARIVDKKPQTLAPGLIIRLYAICTRADYSPCFVFLFLFSIFSLSISIIHTYCCIVYCIVLFSNFHIPILDFLIGQSGLRALSRN